MAKVKDWVEKWKKDFGEVKEEDDQAFLLQGEKGEELYFGHILDVPEEYLDYKVLENRLAGPDGYEDKSNARVLKVKKVTNEEIADKIIDFVGNHLSAIASVIGILIFGVVLFFVGSWIFRTLDSLTVVDEYRVEDSVIIQEVNKSLSGDSCYGVAEYDGQKIDFSSDMDHFAYLKENIGKEVAGEIETEKYKDGDVNYKAVWFWYELE